MGWSCSSTRWRGSRDARLLIVGDGPARAAIEARAAALHLSERLIITGRIPHADVPDYVAAMDVAVVAHDRTGVASPMKLLEYMAMAKVVVAPSLDNVKDVVDDERTGLLFAPGDVEALAAALERLAGDASLRLRLGAQRAGHDRDGAELAPERRARARAVAGSRETARERLWLHAGARYCAVVRAVEKMTWECDVY